MFWHIMTGPSNLAHEKISNFGVMRDLFLRDHLGSTVALVGPMKPIFSIRYKPISTNRDSISSL
jgi:hypothetical protein